MSGVSSAGPAPTSRRRRLPDWVLGLSPTRAQAVDLLGCGGLVGLAVLGFRTTYAGWHWLLVGLVGVLLGLICAQLAAGLTAHLATAWRLPGLAGVGGLVTAGLAAAAYLLLGGPVATRDGLIAGVLPSPATVGALARAAVEGWKQLLTTYPPVDPQGPLMALPLLFGLVGAATCYAVARRWPGVGGALGAIGVPAVLLIVVILLGTLEPASTVAHGAVFAVAALGYAAARAARARPALQNGAGATTRTVTTVALLALAAGVALLVGPRLPGAGTAARTVWRTSLEPPFDVAQFPSPLAGFRRFTEPNPAQLYDKVLFSVSGLPVGTPVRIATLDAYDGSVWGAGADRADSFRRVGTQLGVTGQRDGDVSEATPATEAILAVRVPEGGWGEVWLPTAGTVSGIEFGGARARALHDDLRFNTDTGTGIVPLRLLPGDSYQLSATLVRPTLPPDLALASTDLRAGGQLASTRIDPAGLSVLDAKIDAWSGRESTSWRKLLAVAAVFKGSGAYTDGGAAGDYQNVFLPGHSLARMTRFVKAPQLAGNDEQYAAALALVAARLGVPARVVLGAFPGGDGAVRGRDVHAWVEVGAADGRWQPILPEQFLPDRNKRPEQTTDTSDEKQTGALVPPPAANNPPSILQGPDQAQNTTPNAAQGAKRSFIDPSTWPRWVQLVVGYGGSALLLFGLAAGTVLLLKQRRRTRRRTRGSAAARVAGAWAELLDTARDLRLPVPVNATRLEQAHAVSASTLSGGTTGGTTGGTPSGGSGSARVVGTVGGEDTAGGHGTRATGVAGGTRAGGTAGGVPGLVLLAAASDAHVFGPQPPSDADIDGVWSSAAAAIGRLRATQSRTRRLRGALSLRSLRRAPVTALPTRAGRPTRTPAHRVAAAHRQAAAQRLPALLRRGGRR